LFSHWGKRDPVGLFETYLIEGTLDLESGQRLKPNDGLRRRNEELLSRLETRVTQKVEQAAEDALASARANMPRAESAADGVYSEGQPLFTESAAVNVAS
jgi:TPP-dependent pyruvate/acetoin dehydrogenase alpha subunit